MQVENMAKIFNEFIDHNQTIQILKSDVSALKSDVSLLKTDVSLLKTDVSLLKSDMIEVKSILRSLSARFEEMSHQFQIFQEGLTFLIDERKKDKIEAETIRTLQDESFSTRRVLKDHVLDKSIHLNPKRT